MSTGSMSFADGEPTLPLRLRFLIIGGGIAGVTAAIALAKAGHHVTVLEAQKTFSELGSGIQMPPNSTKHLIDLGLTDGLLAAATSPHGINFRSYRNGDMLSAAHLIPDIEARYHAPHLVLHRGDLLALLVKEAQRLNIELWTDCAAAKIDFTACTVLTVSGRVFAGDVLIGADGVKSSVRDALVGEDTAPQPTGRLVYRLTIPSAAIVNHPHTRTLVEPPRINCWMGPGAHVVCYNLASKGICNVVLTKLDDNPTDQPIPTGPQPAPMEYLHAFFADWDKQLRDVVSMATSTVYWPMLASQKVNNWTHPSGTFILIGDAAHSMEPHLVQGASQAIEDAKCLAELFARVKNRGQIADALILFERLRRPRCSEIARRANEVGRVWALPDGTAQQVRDRQLRAQEPYEYANPFSNPQMQKLLYGYDLDQDVSDAWDKYSYQRGGGGDRELTEP